MRRLTKRQRRQLWKVADWSVAAAAVYTAIAGVVPMNGSIPTEVFWVMTEYVGGLLPRIVAGGLLGWLGVACTSDRLMRYLHRWMYVLACFMFVGAAAYAMRGTGGLLFADIAGRITAIVGVPGLVAVTLGLMVVLFRGVLLNAVSTLADMAASPDEDENEVHASDALPALQEAVHDATFGQLLKDKRFMSDGSSLPIGISEAGELLAESLDSSPHFLVAGKTGSGKTCFLQSAVAALAAKSSSDDIQFVLIDGVRRGLKPLAGLPHSVYDNILSGDDEVIEALKDVVSTLKQRIQSDISAPRLIVVIDEIDGFFVDKPTKNTLEPMLVTIVKKGRQFGVHLIMGSQRPSGDLISPHVLSMMSRICLRVELPKYSMNIIDVPDGATLRGKGDLLFFFDGVLTRAQGFYIPTDDIYQLFQVDQPESFQLFQGRSNMFQDRSNIVPMLSSVPSYRSHETATWSVPARTMERGGIPEMGIVERGTEVVRLKHSGLSFAKIAERLNISKTTAKRVYDKEVLGSGFSTKQ